MPAASRGFEVVCDEHERRARGFVEPEEELEDSRTRLVVEVARGLVGE
jgi:hypothetical protein